MRRRLVFGVVMLLIWFGCGPAAAAPAVEVSVKPAQAAAVLGDRLTISTRITNPRNVVTGPLLAHLNIASLQEGVYVDPEDWSSERSQYLSIQPGSEQTLSWEIQAVSAGRFAVYVVVLSSGTTAAGADGPAVSPMVKLDVAPRATLTAGGALPVVLVVPILLGAIALALRVRIRSKARRRT